jgi:hypothetical protein
VKLALWTPRPDRGWPAVLVPRLAAAVELTVLGDEPGERPEAELDLYDIANDPQHAFVYRALLERPGLVVLADWNLHALVHAATAGQGDGDGYRREARRQRGGAGDFIARQVLQGTGSALARLLPLNGRVLEASVALVTTRPGLQVQAAARLGGRPLLALALDADSPAPGANARALLDLARTAAAARGRFEAEHARRRALEATPLGRALDELRSRSHELGLADPPPSVPARIARLLPGGRADV